MTAAPVKRSALLRKGIAAARRVPRTARRLLATPDDYRARPTVLANSFPKSGTHLLTQILAALPGVREYGTVWASRPSLTYRERPRRQVVRMIGRAVPGELVSGHLFHDPVVAEALQTQGAVHFFIYRDLRDVAVSEAHYLTYMNRWHRLHPTFRRLPDDASRIRFAITGDRGETGVYEDLGARFRRYRGWLAEGNVFPVQFERLVGTERRDTVSAMAAHAVSRGVAGDIGEMTDAALGNIDPSRSHTFRRGRAGGWADQLTDEHRELVKEVAGDLLVELGYETDLDW